MKRYAINTLGCKVNQCESAAMGHRLETAGYKRCQPAAVGDLIVINTCTVTGKAAMQSRQAIRQAIRGHPGATIVVTGCYAQTAPDEIQSIPGIDYIVGHGDKLNLPRILNRPNRSSNDLPVVVHRPADTLHRFACMPSVAPEHRRRAFLKIQDGCNAMCTYCTVPHARGPSRSMPAGDVISHLETLGTNGFRETVLTGIHLGAYGQDLKPPSCLANLLKTIAQASTMERLRISSIEPAEVDVAIIESMADPSSPLCPHFHIPLQSGDDCVLKRMGRPYSGAQFAEVIQAINRAIPHAAIGVDLLVGFPGETERAFEQTRDLIASLPVAYLHIFPFSPRKGTPAAGFKDQVTAQVIKTRCKRMRRLGEKKRAAFYATNIGRRVDLLVETLADTCHGHPKGISDNYIPIHLPEGRVLENSIVTARIDRVESDLTVYASVV